MWLAAFIYTFTLIKMCIFLGKIEIWLLAYVLIVDKKAEMITMSDFSNNSLFIYSDSSGKYQFDFNQYGSGSESS